MTMNDYSSMKLLLTLHLRTWDHAELNNSYITTYFLFSTWNNRQSLKQIQNIICRNDKLSSASAPFQRMQLDQSPSSLKLSNWNLFLKRFRLHRPLSLQNCAIRTLSFLTFALIINFPSRYWWTIVHLGETKTDEIEAFYAGPGFQSDTCKNSN